MDDPFAILRIPSFTVRKESDLPKLKERAKNLVKQYEKVNKFDKAREVEGAYRAVKEMVIKRANCAGSQAFNKVMVNRPGKSTSVGKAPAKEEKSQGPKNPAEVHFLKAQGAAAPAAPAATQAPSQPYKSREERLKEKIEARRAEAGEKNKRAAAIKEKLAAKRAKKDGDGEDGAMVSASSPAEASPLENMASPDSSAVDEDVPQDIQKENGTAESEHQDPPDPTEDAAGEVAVDFF